VIGTIAPRGSLFGRSQDRFIIMPLPAMLHRYGAHQPPRSLRSKH
jgi:hypothetical protein